MKEGWKDGYLSDLVLFQRGFDITKAEQREGLIPVISSSGINSYHDTAKNQGPGIIIGRKGTLGSVHYSSGPYWPHDTTLWSKEIKGELRFIYYLLKVLNLGHYDVGNANPTLNRNHIHKLKIQIPPLPTQRKIASILSAYDDSIENNLKRIKLLEEKAQLTYEEWFVKMRFPGYETANFDEKTGLPEGWEKKEFQFFGKIITGKTPSTANEDFFDGKIPFVKTPDMAGFPYVIDSNQTLTELGANSQKNKYIPKNSLMVSCIGSAGAFALASHDCQTNQQINSIIFYEEYYSFYFYCLAKGLKPILEGLGSNGATMTNVNKGKFEKIETILPQTELLNVFHHLVKNNFEAILNLQTQNRLLKEARDILLPRLMSGMIDVEEMEIPTKELTEEFQKT